MGPPGWALNTHGTAGMGLKYALVPPGAALNSLCGARAGFPRILPEAGYCGGYRTLFYGRGGTHRERRWQGTDGAALNTPWYHRGAALNTLGDRREGP